MRTSGEQKGIWREIKDQKSDVQIYHDVESEKFRDIHAHFLKDFATPTRQNFIEIYKHPLSHIDFNWQQLPQNAAQHQRRS